MSRQPYARILVHRDVLTIAQNIVTNAEINLGDRTLTDEDIRALRDLVDPLPEPDIYGHTPSIDEIELPVITKETA